MTQPSPSRPVTGATPHVPLVPGAADDVYPVEGDRSRPVARAGATRTAKRKAPLAWLPWALLGLLALALLLGLLLASLAKDDDNGSSQSSGSAAASSGQLTAKGADVLGSTGALRGHVGQQADGKGVLVQSVVSDEGFWVGSSASQRVFVHLSQASRDGQAESPYQVRAGDHVDLTGTVQRLGSTSARDFGVTAAEGASQLTSAGAFVEAKSVSLSS